MLFARGKKPHAPCDACLSSSGAHVNGWKWWLRLEHGYEYAVMRCSKPAYCGENKNEWGPDLEARRAAGVVASGG